MIAQLLIFSASSQASEEGRAFCTTAADATPADANATHADADATSSADTIPADAADPNPPGGEEARKRTHG